MIQTHTEHAERVSLGHRRAGVDFSPPGGPDQKLSVQHALPGPSDAEDASFARVAQFGGRFFVVQSSLVSPVL